MSDPFKDLLAKIEDPETKAGIQAEYDKVNRLKGEYGAKLTEKDGEISKLKETTKTWGDAFATLKKNGIEPDKIPGILDKMNIQKTQEEEYELTKHALTEIRGTLTAAQKEVQRLKAEKVIGKLFEKERAELKDTNGKPIKLADRVIDYDKLYDVADLTNETVLKEKIKTVLSEGLTKQTEFLRDVGFQGAALPKTPEAGTETSAAPVNNIKEIMEKQGAVAAIAAMHLNNKPQ